MNAEKVYKVASAALLGHCKEISKTSEEAEKLYDRVSKDPEAYATRPVLSQLGCLARDALEEIAKKEGKGSVLSACKAIIKNASREDMQGAWIDQSGWQNVCDGFRAIRIRNHLDMLPTAAGIDMNNVWAIYSKEVDASLVLPSIGEVKAHIAAEKASGKTDRDITWDFGAGKPQVKAKWLIDLLQSGVGDTAMYAQNKGHLSHIYACGEGVEALLLPVRKSR